MMMKLTHLCQRGVMCLHSARKGGVCGVRVEVSVGKRDGMAHWQGTDEADVVWRWCRHRRRKPRKMGSERRPYVVETCIYMWFIFISAGWIKSQKKNVTDFWLAARLKSSWFKFKATSNGKPSTRFSPRFYSSFPKKKTPQSFFRPHQRIIPAKPFSANWGNWRGGMHTLAPVSAWHPWGAKNSRVCSHISNLFVLQVLWGFFWGFFFCRRGARNRTTTSWNPNKRPV